MKDEEVSAILSEYFDSEFAGVLRFEISEEYMQRFRDVIARVIRADVTKSLGIGFEVWASRVRSILSILESASDKEPRAMVSWSHNSVCRAMTPEKRLEYLLNEAWVSERQTLPNLRFDSLLEAYREMYESWHPILAAPVAMADAILRGVDREGVCKDGKARLGDLSRIATQFGAEEDALIGGMRRHLRNGIAHSNYEILSGDTIRIWDRPPRGGSQLSADRIFEGSCLELQQAVFRYSLTCLGLDMAVRFLRLNREAVVRQEEWYVSPEFAFRYRVDVVRDAFEALAPAFGLSCLAASENERELEISLRIGFESEPIQRLYVSQFREPRALDARLIDVLVILLANRFSYVCRRECIVLKLANSESDIGFVRFDLAALREIVRTSGGFEGSKAVRRVVLEDTIGDAIAPLVVDGPYAPLVRVAVREGH